MSTVADGGRIVCTGARTVIPATDCLSRAPSLPLDSRRTRFNQVDATYRSDLRDLNELNYARFEAKLEQLRAELRSEFQTGLASLEGRLLARIGILEGRFGTLEGRLVRWMFLFWAASLGTVLALR